MCIFRDNQKAPTPTSQNLHGFTRGLNICIYMSWCPGFMDPPSPHGIPPQLGGPTSCKNKENL